MKSAQARGQGGLVSCARVVVPPDHLRPEQFFELCGFKFLLGNGLITPWFFQSNRCSRAPTVDLVLCRFLENEWKPIETMVLLGAAIPVCEALSLKLGYQPLGWVLEQRTPELVQLSRRVQSWPVWDQVCVNALDLLRAKC